MQDNPEREPELVPLEVPLPADAARLFGYPGDSRFVGFYWEAARDEVYYNDARFYEGLGTTPVFLVYRRHPAVSCHLDEYNLGDSDEEATQWLIIDRETNRVSIATRQDARVFLQRQHPPEPGRQLSREELEELVHFLNAALQKAFRELRVDPEEMTLWMLKERRTLERMTAYLDRFIPPESGES
jgi:hypothetical protein